ncbi:MAG TPA: hypothetical protein VH722_08160 [Alphaproteobacteria bacterium]|nr:hypothetical protein [Alphaproteobacteria bacterium]
MRTSTYRRIDLSQPENQALGEATWENQYGTVQRQDYPFGITSPHAAIRNGGNPKFLFGRPELGLQHMLTVTRQLVAEEEAAFLDIGQQAPRSCQAMRSPLQSSPNSGFPIVSGNR